MSGTKVVKVEPEELLILDEHYYQRLPHFSLKNLSNQRIAFKVRASHPTSYIVNPAVGFVNPKDGVLLRVLLQKYTDDTFKEKHYLEVLLLPVGLEDPVSKERFWKEALRRNVVPTSVKLRIRFNKESSKPFMHSRHDASVRYVMKAVGNAREGRSEGEQEPTTSALPAAEEKILRTTAAVEKRRGPKSETLCVVPVPVLDAVEVAEDKQRKAFNDLVRYVETPSDVLAWAVCLTLVVVLIAKRK